VNRILSAAKSPLLLAMAMGAGACASPLHLTYDHGRAYTEAVVRQADLTRPSVANSQYPLYGVEAEQIRIRVQEQTTDEEDGKSTLNQSNR
jgi:hypothetical protein